MYAALIIKGAVRRTPEGHRAFLRGPSHRVAGYVPNEASKFGSVTLFGDYATACGLTLPRHATLHSTERPFLGTRSSCGDCFGDPA